MATILADLAVSRSEFRKNPTAVLREAKHRPVAVLNNNRAAFYRVEPQLFEVMMDELADQDLYRKAANRLAHEQMWLCHFAHTPAGGGPAGPALGALTRTEPSRWTLTTSEGGKARYAYKLRFMPEALHEWHPLDGAVRNNLKKLLAKRLDNPHVPGGRLHGPLAGC